jgi:hypothetical protein
LFQNFSETNRRLGLDVQYLTVYKIVNAYSDFYNYKIYASNSDVFIHEITHLYTNKHYPNSQRWFDEGFATFMGGSVGLSLKEHLKFLKEDLIIHKEYDLTNLLLYGNKKVNVNYNTSYLYVIGGLLCKLVYEKEGYEGIFKLLKVPNNSNVEFYSAIEKHIGVKQENLNEFLRKELEKY